mmetsp:Transcript_105012/g.323919  ORF Transcript_105012/g.323919 Transcript_105012/m.323919 type:complete len:356 (-) Transcript_105012:104-1171(-)
MPTPQNCRAKGMLASTTKMAANSLVDCSWTVLCANPRDPGCKFTPPQECLRDAMQPRAAGEPTGARAEGGERAWGALPARAHRCCYCTGAACCADAPPRTRAAALPGGPPTLASAAAAGAPCGGCRGLVGVCSWRRCGACPSPPVARRESARPRPGAAPGDDEGRCGDAGSREPSAPCPTSGEDRGRAPCGCCCAASCCVLAAAGDFPRAEVRVEGREPVCDNGPDSAASPCDGGRVVGVLLRAPPRLPQVGGHLPHSSATIGSPSLSSNRSSGPSLSSTAASCRPGSALHGCPDTWRPAGVQSWACSSPAATCSDTRPCSPECPVPSCPVSLGRCTLAPASGEPRRLAAFAAAS